MTSGPHPDLVSEVRAALVPLLRDPALLMESCGQWEATICQVGARDRLGQQLLADVIEPTIDDPDLFSRKAIGWALRDHARVAPEWVRTFVAAHPGLSGLSRREALKPLGPPS